MLLLRVELTDRPGALGQVATAMGLVGADINAIEIVERREGGRVVDDFIIDLPRTTLIETVVGACAKVPGAHVLWLSRSADQWKLESDIEVINRMSKDRAEAANILTDHAPAIFRCEWAALVDRADSSVLHTSEDAPEFTAVQIAALGDVSAVGKRNMGDEWLPDWGEILVGFAPMSNNRALVIGREAGPEFLDSELFRLEHLSSVVKS